MLKRFFAIAVIGVAGEYLESRIVGAHRELQHVVIKQEDDKEGLRGVTTWNAWQIQLFVDRPSWATTIGLCRFGYLLAEVAGL